MPFQFSRRLERELKWATPLPKVLYAKGQDWLHRAHIMGRAVGYLPHVGMLTIVMNDYPYAKVNYLVLAAADGRGGSGGGKGDCGAG